MGEIKTMYRIVKVLNNNGVLALTNDNQTEVIILGKGIGFGKRINERFKLTGEAKVYELQAESDRGQPHSLAMNIDPVFIEITSSIIGHVQEEIGEIDTNVLLPLADHIAYAVKRIQDQGYIHNPMTQDIRVLFPEEFKIAREGWSLVAKTFHLETNDDESGYIALHLHGALNQQQISDILNQTQIIHDCMESIELRMDIHMDQNSLSYNRLVTHMKYMLARMAKGESIDLNMNTYLEHQYPQTFLFATELCEKIAADTHLSYGMEEIGYLALHIERVCLKNTKI